MSLALQSTIANYVNAIGEYDVMFNLLTVEYTKYAATGLQFKDWKLEMYGKDYPEGLKKMEYTDPSIGVDLLKKKVVFRITRSQQTLDEYPTRLRVKVKRNPSGSAGEVTLQRITY